MVLTDAIDILQQICYNAYIKIKKGKLYADYTD